MARLAIIWRNPRQVRRQVRCKAQACGNVFLVQELASAAQNLWVNVAALEVVSDRSRPTGHASKTQSQSDRKAWRLSLGW